MMRYGFRGKSFITVLVIGFFCLAMFNSFEPALAQQDAASLKQEDTASEDREAVWTEDAEKKLKTTIEVLEIIRQELKDAEFTTAPAKVQAQPQAAEDEVASWAARISKAVRAMSRVWRKVRKATGQKMEEAGEAVTPEEEGTEWGAKDLSKKFDQAIESMKVIKEELDKIEAEEDKQTK